MENQINTAGGETVEKKGVVRTVADGLRASTKNVREINKANMAAVKADSKENFEKATEPNPDFVEFKAAKGLKNKAKTVARQIKDGAKANSEKEKARREEIAEHAGYGNLLAEQRQKRQAVINKNK